MITLEDTLADIENAFGAYPDSYTGRTQMVTIWMRDGEALAYASDNGSRAFHDQLFFLHSQAYGLVFQNQTNFYIHL